MRDVLVHLHRWTGLSIAVFLVAASLSGSLISFYRELDGWLNPDLYTVSSEGDYLPPSELAQRVESADARISVIFVPIKIGLGESAQLGVVARIDPTTQRPFVLEYDELFADPVNGAIVGTRNTKTCCDRRSIMRFIFQFHHNLLLPGKWGTWLLGGISMLWLLDCFVGFYLTLPRSRPFLLKWKNSWFLKRGASFYRANFDIHRASGLWLWPCLFVLAISSIALNLRNEIAAPVVSILSPVSLPITQQLLDRSYSDSFGERISFERAVQLGQADANKFNWDDSPAWVRYSAALRVYMVGFRSAQFTKEYGLGGKILYYDSGNGRYLGRTQPGMGSGGDLFLDVQLPLHSGRIAGLPGRVFISFLGLAITVITITGLLIWWKKITVRR